MKGQHLRNNHLMISEDKPLRQTSKRSGAVTYNERKLQPIQDWSFLLQACLLQLFRFHLPTYDW